MTNLLYQRCRFCGTVWAVVYVNNGHVNLTSLDGRQFKHNIARILYVTPSDDGQLSLF